MTFYLSHNSFSLPTFQTSGNSIPPVLLFLSFCYSSPFKYPITPLRKRRPFPHTQLPSLSWPDTSPPGSVSGFTQCPTCAQKRRSCSRARASAPRYSPSAAPSRRPTHPRPFGAPTLPFSCSGSHSSHQTAISPPAFPLPHITPLACTSKTLLRQPVFQQIPRL